MTEQTQPDPTGTVISADDQRAIRVAMNAVPYAADRADASIGVTLMLGSSLLPQWGATRWSRDPAAGRSLIGARWRIAL